jgi:hypothetical protein
VSAAKLIPPIEGGHPDARATRSDTKIKLLAGIARARALLDELIAGKVLDIADLAQREKRSIRSTTMQISLAFLAPSLVQAIAENRLPRGIGSCAFPTCRTIGPDSSGGSACKRHGRGAHGVGTPSLRHGVEIKRRTIHTAQRSHATVRSSSLQGKPVSACRG